MHRNATQQTNPANPQIVHVFGKQVIHSQVCPVCKIRSFIQGVKFACCGVRAVLRDSDDFKIEIDSVARKRKPPGAKERKRILDVQAGCCFYCGDQFDSYRTLDGERRRVLIAWDHVVPFSWDGNNWEFVAACRECNAMKHDRMYPTMEDAKTELARKIHERKTRTETVSLL